MINKLFTVLGLTAVLLNGCHKEEAAKEAPPKLQVSSPLRKDTVITKEYVSQIHAFRHIELRALEKGYLQNIYVDEGQTVTQGQPMFKIMPNIYQVDLQKAKAEADVVSIEYQIPKHWQRKILYPPTSWHWLKLN